MTSDENYIDDQDLDAAFQKAAQDYTPDFQESDWTAMSGMLDNIPTPIPKSGGLSIQKRWMLALLLIIGLVSTIGWLYINNANDEVAEDKVGNVSNSEMLDEEKKSFADTVNERVKKFEGNKYVVSEKKDDQEEKGEDSNDNEKTSTIPAGKAAITKEVKSVRNTPQSLENSTRIQPKSDTGKPNDKTDKEVVFGNIKNKEPRRNKNPVILNKGTISNTTDNVFTDLKPIQPSVVGTSKGTFTRTAFASIEKLESKAPNLQTEILFSQPIKVTNLEAVEPVNMASVSRVFHKGLSIRLAYSPDFSTVNSDFYKIGNNSAFLIEYRFDERFVVQSGIIKSLKKYSASPTTYKWPNQWGGAPDNLSNITGTCDMLDIPLNLRFELSQNQTSRFFISTGATNYLMLNELYEYSYYNSPGRWTVWEGKTGFYAFSVLNFSTGFEKSISRKISLQVEPFVKLPVRELGFGKVRLTTLGVFASARINL